MTYRFPRTLRLTSKADFTAVFDERQKMNQGWFTVLRKPNQLQNARLGLVISKCVLNKATSRNYLKRLLREGFRLRQAQLVGLDFVLMARQGCDLENKERLQTELETLWQRLIASCPKASKPSSGSTASS